FLFCGVCGLFFRPVIAVGYVMHGLWDLSHSLSGSSLAGLSLTAIPLGYGIFCATYDFVVAFYLTISDTKWHEPGKLDFYFWLHKPGTPYRRGIRMSAFGGKADITSCGSPLSRSLLGVKQTSLFATHMSAFDPKRTFSHRLYLARPCATFVHEGQRIWTVN